MKIQYQADDGRLFDSEKACREYEKREIISSKRTYSNGYVRREDLNGTIPLSNHGVLANHYTWFEVHSVKEFDELLSVYGCNDFADNCPHYLPDLICVSSDKAFGEPDNQMRNVFSLNKLEDEVYDFYVKGLDYDYGDFRRLIHDRQFIHPCSKPKAKGEER